ncbi:hypothetical protein Vretifemale_17885, partial [Volvox reticuliferus]
PHDPSSFSTGIFGGGSGGDDINSARDDSHADAHENMPVPNAMTNHRGVISLSTVKSTEDRSLIIELEHTHAWQPQAISPALQHVNEQLRSELSHSSSKHMELQTRSKLLHAMLTESGREAERRSQAQQRHVLRMDAQLNGSLHRIRELERINTQLTVESKRIQRQLHQAQAQVSETNHAAATLQ